jgi:sodium/potassium-transporting ATPase subunit alpha
LAIVILIVIFIEGSFSFYQELESARVLGSFAKFLPSDCLVIRDGQTIQVNAASLVVGDIVLIENGKIIPADMRILSASNLKIDKSNLTGENEPVKLSAAPVAPIVSFVEACNIAFMGCHVVEGEGLGIVVAAGPDNQLAKISAQISSTEVRTKSLQLEINRGVKVVGSVAFATMVLVICVWAGYLNVEHNGFMTVGSMIANSISVLIAFVYEGLPVALSTSLMIIARRLCLKYSVLVKSLMTVRPT